MIDKYLDKHCMIYNKREDCDDYWMLLSYAFCGELPEDIISFIESDCPCYKKEEKI